MHGGGIGYDSILVEALRQLEILRHQKDETPSQTREHLARTLQQVIALMNRSMDAASYLMVEL